MHFTRRHGLAVLAGAALTAGFIAGCGSREQEGSGPSPAPRRLTLWHILNYSGPREIVERAVARFEKAHPGVEVEVLTFDNDPYKTKLGVEMAGGTPPDVFFTWGGGALRAYAAAGKVLDLSPALADSPEWEERFLPAAMALCRDGDAVYALPLDLAAVVLWYNAALLREHGLTPPGAVPEMLTASQTLPPKGITPVALGNRKQWPGAFHFVYLATRRGGTPFFLRCAAGDPAARFDDPVFVDAGQHLRTLIDAGAFGKGFNGVEDAQARTRFLTGRAAMYLMGTWLVPKMRNEAPDFEPNLRCVPFPAVPGGKGDPNTVVGGVNAAFAISATCRHPELATDLLRQLTAPEVVGEWCAAGRIPALKATAEQLEALPRPTRDAYDILGKAALLQPYYDQYLPPRLAETHKKTTQEIFAGTLTPEDAARNMQDAADQERGAD